MSNSLIDFAGNWTFKVEKRRVKTKKKTCTVRAFSDEEAIEFARRRDCWDDDPEVTTHIEYVAREL